MIYRRTLIQHTFHEQVNSHLGRTVNEKSRQLFRRLSDTRTLPNAAGRCSQGGNSTGAPLPSAAAMDVCPPLPCTREPRARRQTRKRLLTGARVRRRGVQHRERLKGRETRRKRPKEDAI